MIVQTIDEWMEEKFGSNPDKQILLVDSVDKKSSCCQADMYRTRSHLNSLILACCKCHQEYV